MTPTVAEREITPEEFLRRPDAVKFELIDSHLVERNVSVLSSLVEGIVHTRLSIHCEAVKAGLVWPSSLGIRCFPDAPNKIRRADVSFVRVERFSPENMHEGFLTLYPDLAVEVVSPNDTAYEVAEKVEDFLAAGVLLLWVIYPESRLIEVHRKDGTVSKLRATDELSGEDVLPGFRCRVDTLFPPTASATARSNQESSHR